MTVVITIAASAFILFGRSGLPSDDIVQSFVEWMAAMQKSHHLATCAFPVKHRKARDGVNPRLGLMSFAGGNRLIIAELGQTRLVFRGLNYGYLVRHHIKHSFRVSSW